MSDKINLGFLQYMDLIDFKELCLTLFSYHLDEFSWDLEFNVNRNRFDYDMFAKRSPPNLNKDSDNENLSEESIQKPKYPERILRFLNDLGIFDNIKHVLFIIEGASGKNDTLSLILSGLKRIIHEKLLDPLEKGITSSVKESMENYLDIQDPKKLHDYFREYVEWWDLKKDTLFIFIHQDWREIVTEGIYLEKNLDRMLSIKHLFLEHIHLLIEHHANLVTKFSPLIRQYAIDKIYNKDEEKQPEFFNKDEEDQAEKEFLQMRYLQRLRIAYNQKDICLFLGAGIQKDSGLPDWGELLQTMMKGWLQSIIPNDPQEYEPLSQLIHEWKRRSPIIEAEFVEKANVDVVHSLKDNLTKTKYLDRIDPLLLLATNDTLRDLVYLASVDSKGLISIVNYNYDTLLNRAFDWVNLHMKTDFRIQYHIVSDHNDVYRKNKLPIYHVHGIAPQDTVDKDRKSIVFSDLDYFRLVNTPYYWSNTTQLFFMRENTCLLLGLSGDDPNLRRLLRTNKHLGYNRKILMIQKRLQLSDFEPHLYMQNVSPKEERFLEELLTMPDEKKKKFIEIYNAITEIHFWELGVQIIWVDDYSRDIPKILQQIFPIGARYKGFTKRIISDAEKSDPDVWQKFGDYYFEGEETSVHNFCELNLDHFTEEDPIKSLEVAFKESITHCISELITGDMSGFDIYFTLEERRDGENRYLTPRLLLKFTNIILFEVIYPYQVPYESNADLCEKSKGIFKYFCMKIESGLSKQWQDFFRKLFSNKSKAEILYEKVQTTAFEFLLDELQMELQGIEGVVENGVVIKKPTISGIKKINSTINSMLNKYYGLIEFYPKAQKILGNNEEILKIIDKINTHKLIIQPDQLTKYRIDYPNKETNIRNFISICELEGWYYTFPNEWSIDQRQTQLLNDLKEKNESKNTRIMIESILHKMDQYVLGKIPLPKYINIQ